MDVLTPYALANSAWLALEALPLLFTPSLITSLLSPDPRRPTDLESYLCRALGLSLLTLAATILPLTGILPTGRIADAENAALPYASATVVSSTTFHALSAFYMYTQLAPGSWNFGFTAGITASSALFCFGLWVMLFGGDKARLSKRGADKRTGNFPFPNSESSREKKKEAKAEAKIASGRRSMARTKSRD